MKTNNLKMRNALQLLLILFISMFANAQTELKEQRINDLPTINMSKGVNIHFISPEPVQFVDLSTYKMIGDLPSENIARVKISDKNVNDSLNLKKKELTFYPGEDIGIITVVGQSFMAQYRAIFAQEGNKNIITNIQIQPEDMQPLEFPKNKFSNLELRKFSMDILGKKQKSPIREEKNLKLKMELNNVYVMSDYIFLDITFENESNLGYNIDGIKFSIEDKKIYKATNNQSIEIEPVFKLFDNKIFKKRLHNIYVFKKFTYPNSKVLIIRLLEEQISGRTIEMKIKYSDILNADTF